MTGPSVHLECVSICELPREQPEASKDQNIKNQTTNATNIGKFWQLI